MRKFQKKQAEEFVTLLGQAHDEIRKAIEKKNIAAARSLLADCQDGAIALGDLIEKAEGEGFVTISILEAYCELVYRIYEELAREQAVNVNKVYKMLRQSFFRIESSVKNDIKVQSEAVFLPYKASMWDSLESIWRAADADPDCDAYVVPIPYYDKNPDGSFKEMHYEGGEYPKDVPVIWYENYDFEKRKPDVIFIHNPYDECNIVTSVAPFFYSKNLKNYTDQLVYVPYFILGEIDPEDKKAAESISHFCVVPGVVYADRVIVQSEAMRQAYINVMTEQVIGSGYDRAYWERKILGLGSPKVDKVLSTKKEELEIPEEWQSIIRKTDGTRKKVIFYNTSVTTLIRHNEQYLEKMRDVFRVFYENRDEVVLLWRPHPLIKATIESMRPQLWAEYKEIVAKYQSEGWGIYDDTADMDRAVALSDAYYGDGSSIVQLYQETGKPVMLQNVYSLPGNNYSLAMDNIVDYEGEWWFLALKDNGIYKMNKDTLTATLIVRIPYDVNYFGDHPQYGKIHIYKRKIFVIPMLGDLIAVYDIDKNEIHYINYGKSTPSRGTVFTEKVEYKNKLYLVPYGYEYIVSIDLETEEIKNIVIEKESITKNITETLYAWGSVFHNESKIYFTKILDDKIVCFDLESEKTMVYRCELLKNGGAGICGNEKYIWIVPRKTDRILRWNREKKELEMFSQFPDGYHAGDTSFYKVWLDEELFLLPRDANMCIAVDLENGNMRNVLSHGNEERANDFLDQNMPYSNVWKNKDKVQIISTQVGILFSFEKGKAIYRETIVIDQKSSNRIKWRGVEYERQNRFENIERYIDADLLYEYESSQRDSIGQMIFEVNKG